MLTNVINEWSSNLIPLLKTEKGSRFAHNVFTTKIYWSPVGIHYSVEK